MGSDIPTPQTPDQWNRLLEEVRSSLPNPDQRTKIGEKSTLTVALALAICGLLSGTIWWAATINAKVDILIVGQKTTNGDLSTLKSRVEALEHWEDRVNVAGSPKLGEVEKQIEKLEKAFELHLATTTTDPKKP